MKTNGTPLSTGEGKRSAAARPDPELPAKATRRRFTPRYKLSIIEQADACESPGEDRSVAAARGAVQFASVGMAQVGAGRIAAGAGQEAWPKPSVDKRSAKEVRKLEREIARLREELRKARIVIEVQGKVAGLLGVSLGDGKNS